ncbi:MAG TPA: flagellar basal-body MS-ring/collar protein FliF [Rhizomicrobium sp.]|nr:flagellar basal-body MS-ring/collar protein FliF [Rhizomicrobium sp.]
MPEFLRQFGAARFGVMAGVAAALTAFFLYAAGVISEPAKTILYAGLDPREAAQITAKLDAMSVPYDAKGDGGTILVPSDQVTKLRMELASENLPSAGVGYEIFDKSDAFGATAFVQNINKQRAMEGELVRSIQTIDGIEAARVHLVIPERQIFSRDEQNPSASVVIKTRGTLDRGQVQAIQHLVAAAVSGLNADHVSIVDDRGTLLAGGDSKDGVGATAANQEQHTNDFEDRIRQRIESIVASVVGPGHVRVQISADMNYNHSTETSETYDPDSKVVRSTQTVESSNKDSNGNSSSAVSVANALPNGQQANGSGAGGDSTKSEGNRTEETTNYEISKTVKTSTQDGGDVRKLSVAVVVDGTTTTDAATGKVTGYKPRTAQEMSQIDSLVKSAIGYDKARGDQVQVVNMAFARMDEAPIEPAAAPLLGLEGSDWFKIIEAAIFCVTALLIGFFVARPLIAKVFAPNGPAAATQYVAGGQMPLQLAAPDGSIPAAMQAGGSPAQIAQGGGAGNENMIDISRIEGQVRESSIKKVGEVVQAHPEEALAIIRTWLHQPV